MFLPLAGAEIPSPTLLVLQPEDVAGTDWKIQTTPQLTTADGTASVSARKYGRLAGAVSSYQQPPLLGSGGFPWSLTSHAVIFRDATGAHGAFLEVAAKIARMTPSRQVSTPGIGQEGRSYEQAIIGIRDRSYWVLWRHGNVLALIQAYGEPVALKTEVVKFPQRQQARIAALVPESNPGPPVVVKPVIGKPVAQPVQPRAGKAFGVTFKVTWSNDRTPVASGTLVSSARISGKAVSHGYSFRAGRIHVTLRVPKTANGKRLKITLKVVVDNQTATKVVTYTVQ